MYRNAEWNSEESHLTPLEYNIARCVSPTNGKPLDFEKLQNACTGLIVLDIRERPVVLFEHDWSVRFAQERLPDVEFAETAQGVVIRDV